MSLTISNTAKSYPRLPYQEMKDAVLGKRYQASLTFMGATRAQKLNQSYRNKNYVPNVLSFPLGDDCGEVYICPVVAAKEAPKFSLTTRGYIGYLFIHGLLHLKGLDHGPKMDALEQKYLKQFKLK